MLFEKSLMFMMSSTALRQRTKFWVCEFVCSDQMHHAGVCRTGKEPKVCSLTFNEEGQHPGQRKEAAPNDFQTVIDCAVSLLCVSLSLSLSPLPPPRQRCRCAGLPNLQLIQPPFVPPPRGDPFRTYSLAGKTDDEFGVHEVGWRHCRASRAGQGACTTCCD